MASDPPDTDEPLLPDEPDVESSAQEAAPPATTTALARLDSARSVRAATFQDAIQHPSVYMNPAAREFVVVGTVERDQRIISLEAELKSEREGHGEVREELATLGERLRQQVRHNRNTKLNEVLRAIALSLGGIAIGAAFKLEHNAFWTVLLLGIAWDALVLILWVVGYLKDKADEPAPPPHLTRKEKKGGPR